MPTTDDLAATGKIGRYVDCALLGHGGMGAVYRARDPELDRPVAIKVMLHASEDFVARFRREAQSIARLAHPNIVQVYDFSVDDDGNPYFVMELIDGTPLDQVVRERGRLMPLEAIRLARQAAEGLAAAHRAGIVHRDIKPSNLIVDGRGTLKLVDFGIARVTDSAAVQLTGASALMGTPGYMAPEQAQGKPVDHRADIYALGLTLFELLSGTPPFIAADPITLVVKNMQEPLPDLRVRGLGVPDELVHLIEMMGAKDPEERLQSAEAVAAALDAIESSIRDGASTGGSVPTRKVPPTRVQDRPLTPSVTPEPSATPPPARRASPVMIVGAALALGLGAGALMFLRGAHVKPPTDVVVRPPDVSPVALHVVTAPDVAVHKNDPPPPSVTVNGGPLRVAVLKFKNVGNDPKLAALEQGIGETAVNALAGAAGMSVIERADIESDIGEIDRRGDVHFDSSTVARLGQLRGIELAVQGGFQRAGKQLRITARVVKVENGEILSTLAVTRPANDLFGAQDEVAAGLRGKLQTLVAQREKK